MRNIPRIALMVVLAFAVSASAQTPAVPGAETKQAGMMCQSCQEMMAHQQSMLAQKKQLNDKLDALVRDMNQAPDNRKLSKAVAVINELVTQRQDMDRMMSTMQERMMPGMGQMKDGSAGQCPMMK